MVTQVAWATSSVTVVTMVCFCRVIVVPDSDEPKFAVHTALVPEFATESVPGVEHGTMATVVAVGLDRPRRSAGTSAWRRRRVR